MVPVFRLRLLLSFLLALLGLAVVTLGVVAGPAWAQPEDEEPEEPAGAGGEAWCVATGYLAESTEELPELRRQVTGESVQELAGVPLASGQTWVIPDGSQPLVALDSTAQLSGGTVSVSLAGQEYHAASASFDRPENRYVTNASMPHLGPVVRSLGMTVESGPCQLAVTLAVDRSVWSTLVGAVAVAATILFGLLTVLVARLRKGGWLRRFLFAAPFGLLAGAGQAVVLIEAGVFGPFDSPPWWLPVAGLALAALLPLTRGRRRRGASAPVPSAWDPATVGMPPVQAPLAGYRIDQVVARTEVAGIYRATREADGDRALLKVALPERYGEPAVRLRLEREARVLAGLEHPHLLRLRVAVAPIGDPTAGGPPTLVFEHVAGVPLRQLLAGGALTGPQVVNIVLGVLSGLAAVHARELVHRDVRPENVWLAADGRVLLAGFEVAAPGLEHPVAPEGYPPYASPEQLARQVLDGRSDLWSCGSLLAELLTGVPAGAASGAGMPADLPEPLAAVLARALAADPAGRPTSAEQFAEELREAARQAFGADWLGRAALAGALVGHAAIGAGVAGYGLAGAGGTGAGAGAGAAGAGAGAAGAGGGGAAVAGLGAAAAGPVTGQAVGQAAGQAAGQAGTTGPVGALVNAGVAVVAVIGVVIGVIIADPGRAEAEPSVVITPDQARIIFVRTVEEGLDSNFPHVAEDAQLDFEFLLDLDDSVAEGRPTDVVVGVPPEQYDYPAWFVATALLPYGAGVVSMFARFERAEAGEPWLMTTLNWSDTRLLPPPLLDDDGWLVPPPTVGDLLVDPASLPERYHDWLVRADAAREPVEDEVLELRYDDGGMIRLLGSEAQLYVGENLDEVSSEHSIELGEVRTDLVPLVDGTVHVVFTAVVHRILYNRPNLTHGPCDEFSLLFGQPPGDPPGDFRTLERDMVVAVDAWIPIAGAAPDPALAPDPELELELEPVDPAVVLVEDWRWASENHEGVPC